MRVTLFEDRAEVVRRAPIELKAGVQRVLVGPITPFVDDRSVQAKLEGEGVRVLSAQVLRRMRFETEPGDEASMRLDETIRAARDRVSVEQQALERAHKQHGRVGAIFSQWIDAIVEVPWSIDEAKVIQWRAAFEDLQTAMGAALQTSKVHSKKIAKATDELQAAEARHEAARSAKPICEANVEVQIEVSEPLETELVLTYRTPCAFWRPEHLARLTCADEQAEGAVEIVTWATAWQRTGERWDDVEVCFSTARPARASSPPLLTDDVVWSRRKSAEERKHAVVETWDQEVEQAAVSAGKPAVEEMPGVDDGGEPQVYQPSRKVSLVSDGQPFRVEIARHSHDAKVERVLLPERSAVAHLKARATHKGERPLLAGPARIARDKGMVGLSRLDFVAAGEPYELGFGSDDAIRVKRQPTEERDKVKVIGTQIRKRKVKLFVSNLSGDSKVVRIVERIPVSELEQVEVLLKRVQGWTFDDDDGFLTQRVHLAPRETKKLEFSYEVRADSKVQLPF